MGNPIGGPSRSAAMAQCVATLANGHTCCIRLWRLSEEGASGRPCCDTWQSADEGAGDAGSKVALAFRFLSERAR